MTARTRRLGLTLLALGLSLCGTARGQAPGMFQHSLAAPEGAPYSQGYGAPAVYGPAVMPAAQPPAVYLPPGAMVGPYGASIPGQTFSAYPPSGLGVTPAGYVQPPPGGFYAADPGLAAGPGAYYQPGPAITDPNGQAGGPLEGGIVEAGAEGGPIYDPDWFFAAGTVAYHRSRGRHVLTTVDDANTFNVVGDDLPVMGTDNLEFDHNFGVRGDLRRRIAGSLALQVFYFGGMEWKEGFMVRDVGQYTGSLQALSPPDGLDVVNFNNPDPNSFAVLVDDFYQALEHNILYKSRFHNGELNLREAWLRSEGPNIQTTLSVLAGARYIKLSEDFSLMSVDFFDSTLQDGVGYYLIRTNNDLVGGQIGCDLETVHQLQYRRVGHGATIKVGGFWNMLNQRSTIFNDGFGTVDARADDVKAAIVSELELYGWFDITRWLQFRAGYSTMWLNGVALATEQYTFEPFTQNVLNHNGGIFYHGANLSLVITR